MTDADMGVQLALAGGLAAACVVLIATLLLWRSERRRHRRLLDSLPQTAIAVFDRELRVRYAAGPALDLGGRAAPEAQGDSVLGNVPQAQREPLLNHYRAALRGEMRSFEYRSPTHRARVLGPRRAARRREGPRHAGALGRPRRLRAPPAGGPRRDQAGRAGRGHRRDQGARPQRRPDRRPHRGLRGRQQGRRRPGRRAVRARAQRHDADRQGQRRRRDHRLRAAVGRRGRRGRWPSPARRRCSSAAPAPSRRPIATSCSARTRAPSCGTRWSVTGPRSASSRSPGARRSPGSRCGSRP